MLHLSYALWFYPWNCQLRNLTIQQMNPPNISEINTEQQGNLVLCTWIS